MVQVERDGWKLNAGMEEEVGGGRVKEKGLLWIGRAEAAGGTVAAKATSDFSSLAGIDGGMVSG